MGAGLCLVAGLAMLSVCCWRPQPVIVVIDEKKAAPYFVMVKDEKGNLQKWEEPSDGDVPNQEKTSASPTNALSTASGNVGKVRVSPTKALTKSRSKVAPAPEIIQVQPKTVRASQVLVGRFNSDAELDIEISTRMRWIKGAPPVLSCKDDLAMNPHI